MRTLLVRSVAFASVVLGFTGVSLAGRGATNSSLAAAVASNSPDAIIAELERAEKLVCVSCVTTVLPLLDHPDSKVRSVAAWWINKRGTRFEVRDTAYARLQGQDAVAARNGAEALGTMRHAEAVPALTAYLAKPLDGPSGAAAAQSLGTIGVKTATPALVSALSSPFVEVRAAAARSLREVPNSPAGALVGLLSDPAEQVRTEAIFTIGQTGDRTAVTALMNVLQNDAVPSVRKHAAWALGQLGDSTASPALQASVANDPDGLVRSISRTALARLR